MTSAAQATAVVAGAGGAGGGGSSRGSHFFRVTATRASWGMGTLGSWKSSSRSTPGLGGTFFASLRKTVLKAPNSRSGQLTDCQVTTTCVVGRTWARSFARSRSMQVSMEKPASTGVLFACIAALRPPRMLHPAPEWAATTTRPRSIDASAPRRSAVRSRKRSRSNAGQESPALVMVSGSTELGAATIIGATAPASIISDTMRRRSPSAPPPIQRYLMASPLLPWRKTNTGSACPASAVVFLWTKARPIQRRSRWPTSRPS